MNLELADFAVREGLNLGAGYVEARMESETGKGFLLKNGIPEVAGINFEEGLSVRFLKGKAMGFISTNELSKDAVSRLLRQGISRLHAANGINADVSFSVEKASAADYTVKQKTDIMDVSDGEKFNHLIQLYRNIKKAEPSLLTAHFSFSNRIREKLFVSSEGARIHAELPELSFFYLISVGRGSNTMQHMWQYGGSGGFELFHGWELEKKLASRVKALAKVLEEGKPLKPGSYDVVCGPEVTGLMSHESVGHPYEADRILGREAAQAGESFITPEMRGTRIGSEHVTVIDDPTMPGSYGFYLYDEEGVKAGPRTLIDRGIIGEFLHNRESAAQLGTRSNAAARASDYGKEPIIRMANTYVKPGSFSDDELFESIKQGVYVKSFMEWNIDDKRFNQKYVGAESYLIENGKITSPVRNPVLELTTPALWKSVDAVGKKPEFHAATCGKGEPMQGIPVFHGGPNIRLRNIRMK